MSSRHTVVLIALALLGIAGALTPALAEGWQTEKLSVAVNLSEEYVDGESSSDLALTLDAIVSRPIGGGRFEFTVDSDYDRSFEGDAEDFDRLKTWSRYLIGGDPRADWTPLIVISTEGDHGLDSVQTLGAFGWRKYMGKGFIELTAGVSKDVRTAAPWVGDVGALFSFEQNWGRLSWNVHPEASYGILGETRLRDEQLIYSLSSGLNYAVGEHLGMTYRVQFNNSQGDDRRHQFLGLSYSR